MAFLSSLLTGIFVCVVVGSRIPHARSESSSRWERTVPQFISYSALGDSYASGDGPTPPVSKSRADATCVRTEGSYPFLLFQKYGGKTSKFQFLACADANTTDIDAQVLNPNFGHPDFVTITAGGDDDDFLVQTLNNCLNSLAVLNSSAATAVCDAWLVQASAIEQTLKPGISALIANAVSHNLPSGRTRKVVVTGYAQAWNISGNPSDCPTTIPTPKLGPGNIADRVNLSVLALNAVLAAAAFDNGALYADIDAAFDGHRVCDPDSYFQTDATVPGADLAHPTAKGYAAMAEAVARVAGFDGELAGQGNSRAAVRS